MEQKFDIYKKVTQEIVTELANGDIPWRKKWCSPVNSKVNYKSRRSYNGVNLLNLREAGEYLTFKQCQELNGTVKKGEHAHTIYQFVPYVRPQDKEEYERRKKNGEDTKSLTIPLLKFNKVFHLSQTEGIESKFETVEHKESRNPVDIANYVIEMYKDANDININETARDSFVVNTSDKSINIPQRTQFPTEEQFYNTLFSGLAKYIVGNAAISGDEEKYNPVRDELVCEIAACMMMSGVGLTIPETKEDTLAACSKWAKELNKDYRLIVQAAAKAQKVAEKILSPII